MRIQKLDLSRGGVAPDLARTDAFIAWDLEGASTSVGVVRLAPKILQDGAELLARSISYSFASFGLKLSGASAGINAKPDDRDTAITAFMEGVAPLVGNGSLVLHPGTGVVESDLAALVGSHPDPTLAAHGAVAAAEAAVATLQGTTVAVVGGGPVADAARTAAAERGATVDQGDEGLAATADVLFVAGKAGMVDHDAAATVKARAIVPLTPVPVTAKAFAVLRRQGTVYVPDFLSLAAPLLAAHDPSSASDPVTRVSESVREIAGDGVDAWLVAVGRAEGFLRSWQDALPFGRPLA